GREMAALQRHRQKLDAELEAALEAARRKHADAAAKVEAELSPLEAAVEAGREARDRLDRTAAAGLKAEHDALLAQAAGLEADYEQMRRERDRVLRGKAPPGWEVRAVTARDELMGQKSAELREVRARAEAVKERFAVLE